jgi:uncharacterized membrane protein AbrB (regulator of aidB expression)
VDKFIDFIAQSMVLNNLILVVFLVGFAFLFMKESNNPNSKIQWSDLITDPKTKSVSLSKFGQFFGLAMGSWIIVYLAQVPAAYAMYPMIFTAYLAFIGGSWSWNRYLKSKEKDEE